MKLYVLTCGRIRCRKNVFIPEVPKDDIIEGPMSAFVIVHPRGSLLFDTGPHPSVFGDAFSRWGAWLANRCAYQEPDRR